MAAAAILNFGKMSITLDWIKISCIKLYGKMHHVTKGVSNQQVTSVLWLFIVNFCMFSVNSLVIKGMGCKHAINTVRLVIEQLTKGWNTVNLCAIDLRKAFDKVNHHALLIKLMKTKLPVILLEQRIGCKTASRVLSESIYSRPPSRSDLELDRGLYYHPFCLPSI